MAPKVIKIEALGVQGMIFLILMDFGKLVFLMFWVLAKGGPQKQNKSDLLRKGRVQNRDAGANHNPGGPTYGQILARL